MARYGTGKVGGHVGREKSLKKENQTQKSGGMPTGTPLSEKAKHKKRTKLTTLLTFAPSLQ